MTKMVPKWPKWYPIYDQNCWKTLPFGAAHTYIAHKREYPHPPGTTSNTNNYLHRTVDLYMYFMTSTNKPTNFTFKQNQHQLAYNCNEWTETD